MIPSRIIAVVATLLVLINEGAKAQTPAGRFEKEIAAYEAADRAMPPQPGGIVFTGASGIRMWRTLAEEFAGLPVINRGFGGSDTISIVILSEGMDSAEVGHAQTSKENRSARSRSRASRPLQK